MTQPTHTPHFGRRRARRAFTLIEVMIAVTIIAMAFGPLIGMVQEGRINARSTSVEVIGQNLAVSMMELVKRSGYANIAYGQTLPTKPATATSISPLLDLPRQIGSKSGAAATTLPAAAPGGANVSTVNAFLVNWRSGSINRASGVVTSSANYLFFSPDQIAALGGYANNAAVPAGTTLLDPQFAWGLYVNTDAAGAGGGVIGYPLKHIAVVVKWIDPRRNRIQYTVIESYVSQVALQN